jgi:hypothetical protein
MLASPFEQAQVFLPKYLSPEDQRELYSELQQFPEKLNYYLSRNAFPNNVLQGDGWRGFVVIDFETSDRKNLSAVVISNSCDIDPANQGDSPRKILFAPIVGVEPLSRLFVGSEGQITDKVAAVRQQKITTMFYLPELPGVMQESVALLDDIHQQPLGRFLEGPREKIFTLSQVAFWIFLIKLSIHFTRANEGARRV